MGQKGFEVLQLLLAAVQFCLFVLGLLGRGREGHWAVGSAPHEVDPSSRMLSAGGGGFPVAAT